MIEPRIDPRACACEGSTRCATCDPLFTTPAYIRLGWVWAYSTPARELSDLDYEFDILANYPNYDHL